MLAPRIARATTKEAASSSSKRANQRPHPVEGPLGLDAAERVQDHQAAMQVLAKWAGRATASEPGGEPRPPGSSWDLSRIFPPGREDRPIERFPLTTPPPGVIQPKLEIGAVNDPLEREADHVAAQVMRMPEPGAAARPGISGAVPGVQRKCSCGGSCDKCKTEPEEDEHRRLQMKPAGVGVSGHTAAPSIAPPIVHEVLRSPGRSLDPLARAFFEPRFGHGFNQVRVHTDTAANESAGAVSAHAYTVGHQIVFGAGRYAPATADGAKLIAHELAHVVQQSREATEPTVQRAPAAGVEAGATCDVDQKKKIKAAADKANDWLTRAISAIEAFNGLPWAKRPVAALWAGDGLSKHFHSTDPAVVAYVKARLEAIQKDIFGRQNFQVNCPPASDQACALGTEGEEMVARVPNSNEVDFCRLFFKRSVEDDASTIVHEFAHALLGLRKNQDIIDRAYKSDRYYPYLTTAEALTNAESYAMFAREVATGSSPAPAAVSDDIGESCPDDWVPLIQEAMRKARMWNHRAALSPTAPPEFLRAYRVMDGKLTSNIGFKCVLDKGYRDRCVDGAVYWLYGGDLRICKNWRQIASPDDRALEMLAGLYGYKDQLDDNNKRHRAAQLARDLHSAYVPSTAEVISEK